MLIRLATMTDAPGMAQVMVDTWLAAHREQVPEGQWQRRREEWSYADSERSWRRLLAEIEDGSNTEDCPYVAVSEEGAVVGIALGCPAGLELLPNAAEVSALYVRPTEQGQGLGRRLVQAVAAHQARLGRQALMISVLTNNAPARRFYEALGGQLIGTRQTEDYGYPEPQVVYGWPDIRELACMLD
ncbi:MAG: GNAT family N-acetyltransferase [Caldilinea sp. CFX5]|nr:GNAT family N-acetyltransferase [Caldilinea sp. CFX5]